MHMVFQKASGGLHLPDVNKQKFETVLDELSSIGLSHEQVVRSIEHLHVDVSENLGNKE